jgi:hypothetical protein
MYGTGYLPVAGVGWGGVHAAASVVRRRRVIAGVLVNFVVWLEYVVCGICILFIEMIVYDGFSMYVIS